MLKKDLMNETYCGWCFFFNNSRNKRAVAVLHNPCGFVTDLGAGKPPSAVNNGKSYNKGIIFLLSICLPSLRAIDPIVFE